MPGGSSISHRAPQLGNLLNKSENHEKLFPVQTYRRHLRREVQGSWVWLSLYSQTKSGSRLESAVRTAETKRRVRPELQLIG